VVEHGVFASEILEIPFFCCLLLYRLFRVDNSVNCVLLLLNDKCCLSASHEIKGVDLVTLLVAVVTFLHEVGLQVLADPDQEALAANAAK
jgi:hypothetical protein